MASAPAGIVDWDRRLDSITSGRMRDIGYVVDRKPGLIRNAILSIHAQPASDRLPLLGVLEKRLGAYAKTLAPPRIDEAQDPERHAKLLLKLTVGYDGSMEKFVIDKIEDAFVDYIKALVNSIGKRLITFLKYYWSLVSAKTPDELLEAILGIAVAVGKDWLIKYIKGNWLKLLARIRPIIGAQTRNYLEKTIVYLFCKNGIRARIGSTLAPYVYAAGPWLAGAAILLYSPDAGVANEKLMMVQILIESVTSAEKDEFHHIVVGVAKGRWILSRPLSIILDEAAKGSVGAR